MTEKCDFIEVYENVFSKEYCESIISYFNKVEELGLVDNRQKHNEAKKLKKEDQHIFLPTFELPMHVINQTNVINEFNQRFWEIAYNEYAEKYDTLSELDSHKNYILKIQKTNPGQGYHVWHCETGGRKDSSRLLAWTVYLNDDFEAGETEFLYQQKRIKPKQGSVCIFPAAFTHTHRGNPPINGSKYIITGWIEF
jgi:hypothetical protein